MTVPGRAPERAGPGSAKEAEEVRPIGIHRTPLAILGLSMGALTTGRLVLWLAYPSEFAALSGEEIGGAFLRGLRFDLAVTLWIFALPAWLLWWPARRARSRAWQRACGWAAFGLFTALLFVTTADLVYFSVVSRHIGHDFAVGGLGDPGTVARASIDYPLPWLGLVAALGASFLLWRRLLRRPAPVPRRPSLVWGWCLVFPPLALFAARGGAQEMPLAMVDAFRGRSVEAGYLTLNGPFSIIYTSTRASGRWPAPFERAEAIDMLRSGLSPTPSERWGDNRFPLQREPVRAAGGPGPADGGADGPQMGLPSGVRASPNVILVVFEGLDAWVSDAIRREGGLSPLGATPNFDALAARGMIFTRLLGHGQLSIEGLGAILSSFPSIPGLPTHGRGLGLTRLSYLGTAAREMGYRTYFVRSAHRESFRLDAFSALAGFEQYAGREDITAAIESHTEARRGHWGAWDFDALRYLHERLAASERPFLAVFFGSSTHPPYPSPRPLAAVPDGGGAGALPELRPLRRLGAGGVRTAGRGGRLPGRHDLGRHGGPAEPPRFPGAGPGRPRRPGPHLRPRHPRGRRGHRAREPARPHADRDRRGRVADPARELRAVAAARAHGWGPGPGGRGAGPGRLDRLGRRDAGRAGGRPGLGRHAGRARAPAPRRGPDAHGAGE